MEIQHLNFQIPQEQLRTFAQEWEIIKIDLFGSSLRDDFRANSDIDLLVQFDEHAHPTLFDMVRILLANQIKRQRA